MTRELGKGTPLLSAADCLLFRSCRNQLACLPVIYDGHTEPSTPEDYMKKMLIAGTAAIAVLASSQILSAQTTTIEIAPEQRTRIKEYVVKEKVRPVTVKERVSVGATLPADVELVAVPETWGPSVSKYRYVYSDNHVVLVEPSSRRVVQIID